MSLHRALLALFAAVVISAPVFADDTNTNTTSTTTTTMTTSDNSQTDKLDLNKATTKQLMKVKGLNASKARAIVAYRKKHGDFKSLDELTNVKGFKKINQDQMKEIQDQLSVD